MATCLLVLQNSSLGFHSFPWVICEDVFSSDNLVEARFWSDQRGEMTTLRAKNIEKIPNYWFSPRDSREQQGGVCVRGGCAAEPSCFPHLLPGTCSSYPGSTWVAAPLLSCSDKCGASGQVMGMCDCKCFPASWSQVMIVQIWMFVRRNKILFPFPSLDSLFELHLGTGQMGRMQSDREGGEHVTYFLARAHHIMGGAWRPSDGIWTKSGYKSDRGWVLVMGRYIKQLRKNGEPVKSQCQGECYPQVIIPD